MAAAFDPGKYLPSIKTKRKNKTPFFTVNSEGNKFVCVTSPFEEGETTNFQQLVFDPSTLDSYRRFIHQRILDIDDKEFTKKIETYGYGECAVYTWILESNDEEKSTLEDVALDTPLKMYMTKVVSSQEIGTTHFDLSVLHPRTSSKAMPIIGAGELRVVSPSEIQFNLLSGTFMAKKILKNKSKLTQDLLQEKISILVKRKLSEKGFTSESIGSADLIEGKCFTTSKENMNTLRSFFKNTTKKNKNNTKNKTVKKNSSATNAAGAGAH